MGNRRFEEFQAYTEATPQMVAARLKKLEAEGLTRRRIYNRRPLRREYHLTEKGEAFFPVLPALRAWVRTGASRRRKAKR
jgi:DNA-binding HxlR family transcriptional regulator